MKRFLFASVIAFACFCTQAASNPQVLIFSHPVSGTITGHVEAVIINTGGWQVLDVVAGSAVAKSSNLSSWADAKKIDDHNIEVSYSFGGFSGAQYRGEVTVKAVVI